MFGLGCAAAATPADAMSMSEKSVVRWKKQAVGIVRGGFIRVSDYTLATAQATPLAIRTRRRTGGNIHAKADATGTFPSVCFPLPIHGRTR